MSQKKSSRRSTLSRFLYFYNDFVMGISITAILIVSILWYRATSFWFDPLMLAIILTGAAIALRVTRSRMKVFIKEREIGIIFEKRGNFIGFLPPGTHFINPIHEKLEARVPMTKIKSAARSEYLRTREGIRTTIHWEVEYLIDINYALKKNDASVGYTLANLPLGKINGMTQRALRNLVEQRFITQLYEVQEDKVLLDGFEKILTDKINKKLNNDPLILEGSYKAKIGPILLPQHLENELEEKAKRYAWNLSHTER